MRTPLADALIFIRHHQDGEIAEKLRNSGLQYNMNYGVSSLLLSNYAKTHGRDQELADLLWNENFREAKLMTFMLADPQTITETRIADYVAGCANNEMVEIAAMHLFSQLPNAFQWARKWISSPMRYKKMLGYLVIARLTITRNFGTVQDLASILTDYERDILSTDYFVFQAVEKAFQEIAYRCQDLYPLILEKTKYICTQNKSQELSLQLQEMLRSIN